MTNANMPSETPVEGFIGGFSGKFIAFSRLVARRFANDGGMRIAASLSYTSLLALVPLGAIAFAVLKAFPVFDNIRDRLQSLVFETFLPETIANVQEYFVTFVGKAGGLTAIGIVALAVIAIMLLATIEAALNDIFRVKSTRAFIPRMMMFWAVMTLGPLLMGGSLSLATYLFALTKTVGVDQFTGFGWLMTSLLPSVLAIFAFTVFYAIVPYRPVKVVHALIGGICAGVLFAFVRKGFALYVTAFPAYQTLYGALSTVPIFLIWMYLSWAVVLVGAEITAALPEWGTVRAAQAFRELSPARRLEAAVRVLEILWRQSLGESVVSELGALKGDELDDGVAEYTTETLDALRQAGFVALSEDDHWLIARDLSKLTLRELAHGLKLAPDPADLSRGGVEAWQPRLKSALERSSDGWKMGVDNLFH